MNASVRSRTSYNASAAALLVGYNLSNVKHHFGVHLRRAVLNALVVSLCQLLAVQIQFL